MCKPLVYLIKNFNRQTFKKKALVTGLVYKILVLRCIHLVGCLYLMFWLHECFLDVRMFVGLGFKGWWGGQAFERALFNVHDCQWKESVRSWSNPDLYMPLLPILVFHFPNSWLPDFCIFRVPLLDSRTSILTIVFHLKYNAFLCYLNMSSSLLLYSFSARLLLLSLLCSTSGLLFHEFLK